MSFAENKPPVLYILVVGFHHKLGCQIEFSHPPLLPGSEGKNECPSGWKYLSTLALPDGSHNFVEDTVFFNLPSLTEPSESIYGVSCYRQMSVEKLKNRTPDMTRSTVQKSVCCLTRFPIYGYVEVKLSLIADAFFDQGDFSNKDLLIKAYQQLNDCLLNDKSLQTCSSRHQFYIGLSLREIALHWRHKMLQLFKLFLLQRRVICFGSPVRNMCVLILGISSLIPRLLERGFQEVACVQTSRPLSPMPDYSHTLKIIETENKYRTHSSSQFVNCPNIKNNSIFPKSIEDSAPVTKENLSIKQIDNSNEQKNIIPSNSNAKEVNVDSLNNLSILASIQPDEYRAPVAIFSSGNLCLPYLSLPYMDLLTDPSVLSYVIGTSNVLFQQKRHLSDVLIDIENFNIDILHPELKRQLILSTEDLRFMDYILRSVQSPREEAKGGDNWIREQFQGYLLSLLRTTVSENISIKCLEHFNTYFVQAFKKTSCFHDWLEVKPPIEFFNILPVDHPFAGTLTVSDMKLKIAQTIQSSESGRKINQAVNTTSRAVGGAISQAKDAFSQWWSAIITPGELTSTSNIDIGDRPRSEFIEIGKEIEEISNKLSTPIDERYKSNYYTNPQEINLHHTGDIHIV